MESSHIIETVNRELKKRIKENRHTAEPDHDDKQVLIHSIVRYYEAPNHAHVWRWITPVAISSLFDGDQVNAQGFDNLARSLREYKQYLIDNKSENA